jgi:hypothetical protein
LSCDDHETFISTGHWIWTHDANRIGSTCVASLKEAKANQTVAKNGGTKCSITTLSITAFSITILNIMTLSIKTLGIMAECSYAKGHLC